MIRLSVHKEGILTTTDTNYIDEVFLEDGATIPLFSNDTYNGSERRGTITRSNDLDELLDILLNAYDFDLSLMDTILT
ncbi:hypothetical protein HF295_06860 [Hujiaoplasma nucleasis]|uniref:Uncharacterized protein n=1 Tax=Hujiaoplasma nucleasis TaxID=2725268 RepID=A0A7L6N2T0_9MOLU|nr:hypothetical protein [Hujiaoplasma nucleasis]QLY40576.1 hypothetical protein HF295_06860 [Hujiaoplasma nucleasis]